MGSIPLGTSSGNWKQGGGTVASLSAPVSQGGSLKVVQPTYSNYQTTKPTSYFQPAQNVQKQTTQAPYRAPVAQGGGGGTTTGGGGGGYDPYAAQRAAQEQARREEEARIAAEEAKKAELRGTISGLIDQAMGVYDTLYGNVRNAATSQRQLLEERFNKETGALTDQFNAEIPKIGKAYAGRGTYDSTFRQGSEYDAGQQFKGQLDTLGSGYRSDQAKIGQELMAQEASIGADRSLLDLVRSRLGDVTDLNELMGTRNDIDKKIAEVRGKAQSTGTQQAYQARFGQLAPAANRINELQTQLTNIINGQAPSALKRQVAQQIIGSAGLPKEQEDQLNNLIVTQLG